MAAQPAATGGIVLPRLELGDLSDPETEEASGRKWSGINDWCRSGDKVSDQMTSARADTETMAAEAGGQDQAGQGRNLADGGDAVGCRVDIAGPACS